VALIAIYRPYVVKPEEQKYDPEKRSDVARARAFAANEIRHAANGANQRASRSKSAVVKALAPEFAEISKICADLEGADEELAKCISQVDKLDAALQEHASKASAAGATGKMPRVADEFVTPAAKDHIKLYLRAKGPGPEEQKYLEMRRDPKLEPDALVEACNAAAAEATDMFNFMGKTGNEDVRKVSAHHKAATDGQCNRLKDTAAQIAVLKTCKEREKEVEKDEELQAECRLACSKAKGRIARGIVAGAFEQLVGLNEDVCVKKEE
jgi:hypothetical protein